MMIKSQLAVQERKKGTDLPAGILSQHAAVRSIADHSVQPEPANALNESRFGEDSSQVSVHSESGADRTELTPPCPVTPTRCPFGGACHTCPVQVQTKLAMNHPGDEYEQEADRAADQLTRAPGAQLKRRATGQRVSTDVPTIVHEVLRSSGQPLDAATRTFMEPRFGHDFSQVRVHTDAQAAESARALNALAYTVGRDVVFGRGQYAPGANPGRKLMAHELAHVVQQGNANDGVLGKLIVDRPVSSSEQEAERAAETVITDQFLVATARDGPYLARQTDTPESEGEDTQVSETCTPATGIPPTDCSAYLANSWWLPFAYVNNATCACQTTPDSPTANCVREFLQDRLGATPAGVKALAASQKVFEVVDPPAYQAFVQTTLTPRIYQDHVDAYRNCCCPSTPAPYPAWMGVTSVPIQPCSLVGLTIRYFGSCHGTPGAW
jgi:hypothetical protein